MHLDVTPETTATGGVVEDTPVIEAVYLPDYVITGSGSLELSIQGSLVGALEEELEYFAPYPSGWWESNVRKASRVIATIAVQRTQADGLDEAQVRQLNADLAVLVREQQYDGGWGWCKNCGTNLWITGWVLVALGEARDAGHVVPDRALTNTWQLIRSHLNRETDVERPADPNQHAFLLYALASASEHVQEASELTGEQAFAMRVIVNDHRAGLTSWGRAYLLLGLIATGHEADHVDVRILLNDLTATTIASANGNHWEAKRIAGSMHNSSVRPTALVLRALTEGRPEPPADRGDRTLARHRAFLPALEDERRARPGHGLARRICGTHRRDAGRVRLLGAGEHLEGARRRLRRASRRLPRRHGDRAHGAAAR